MGNRSTGGNLLNGVMKHDFFTIHFQLLSSVCVGDGNEGFIVWSVPPFFILRFEFIVCCV